MWGMTSLGSSVRKVVQEGEAAILGEKFVCYNGMPHFCAVDQRAGALTAGQVRPVNPPFAWQAVAEALIEYSCAHTYSVLGPCACPCVGPRNPVLIKSRKDDAQRPL